MPSLFRTVLAKPDILKLLALATLALGIPAPAWCWGQAGHRIVAMIAEQRLSPEARGRVSHLLFDGRFTMPDVSACPDALRAAEKGHLRPDEEYCLTVAGSIPKDSSPWHYIDIPVPTSSHSLDEFCPGGNCIVAKIKSFTGVLGDASNDAERRAALMYIIHLIGDIYQPLHCVERKCDQGGNLEHVNFYLKNEERADHRLHSVWDSDLIDKAMADARINEDRLYAASLLHMLKEKDAAEWSKKSIDEIAWEGHSIASHHVYRGIPEQDFCPVNGVAPEKPAHPVITDLTPGYEKDAANIVREQLLKAGVRLADVIEKTLAR